MNFRPGSVLTLALLAYLMLASGHAAADEPEQAQAGAGLTIYLDVGLFKRPKKAAAEMTKLHASHYAKGWTVVDVDPYIENGDLQGFFITYVGRE